MPDYVIGIDVGGTKIAAGIVDIATGAVMADRIGQTNRAAGSAAALHSLAEIVRQVLADARSSGIALRAIGIGVPELVDNDGAIRSTWNFDWRESNLADVFETELPVIVESDARCGAAAELKLGAGRGRTSFSYVTVGTGIAAVQCIGGALHRGQNGFAIHFGSSDMLAADRVVPGLTRFNLEGFASGLGIATTFAARHGRQGLSARDLSEGRGGTEGFVLVEEAAEALASYAGQMVNLLDLEAIIIGGGLGMSSRFFDKLRARTPEFIWAESCRDIPILRAEHGVMGPLLGAALLAAESVALPMQGNCQVLSAAS